MVAGASAVLVTPVAALPLFLSSAGTAAVAEQVRDRCPRDTGVSYLLPMSTGEIGSPRSPGEDPFRALDESLGPVTQWMRTDRLLLEGASPLATTDVVVLVRDGAADNVDVLEGDPGPGPDLAPGAWLTDRAVRDSGLAPGDTAVIGGAEVPVAGVYRDLAGSFAGDFWCAHNDLLVTPGFDPVLPPPLVLVDRPTFARLADDLGIDPVIVAWEAPLRRGMTATDADALVDDLGCLSDLRPSLEWCSSPGAAAPGAPVPGAPVPGESTGDFVTDYFGSHLPYVIERSRSIRTSVAGGVWPVAGCAALAGVGFVAAAAGLWFDRRRREVTLLTVRGVSPAALGLKAVLELIVPLVAGAGGGVALAYGLVRWLGPSSDLEPSALTQALVTGAAGLAVAIAAVGIVVAHRSRPPLAGRSRVRIGGRVRAWTRSLRLSRAAGSEATSAPGAEPADGSGRESGRPRWAGWWRAVPWELALAALAVVSYRRLGDWGVPVSDGAKVSRVDPLGLLFPALFLLTAVGVAARLLLLGLGPLRRLSRSWPTSLYLAVRRVARYRVAVVGLVAASAVASGVLGYAATLNRSLDATLGLKAQTFVGSDVAVRLTRDAQLPPALEDQATTVEVYRSAWIATGRGESEVGVLAIDPATFAGATFWDATLSGTGLDDILDRLARPAGDGPIPAVITPGGNLDGDAVDGLGSTVDARIRGVRTSRFALEPVAEVEGFPGMRRPTPTVFVAAANLADLGLTGGSTESWIRGDRDRILASLADNGTTYLEVRRAVDVVDRMAFLTVAWTFDFVQAIAVTAGLLVLGGLAAYLDARRRDRLLGYAFARRMGLSSGQHRLALLAELAASVVVGCWLGLGIALAGAWLAHRRIDPVPDFRPGPVLRPATTVVVVLAVAAAVVAVLAAALAQRRADDDSPVEILRAGA
jgi:putative ABC transport system permease protein